MFHFMYNYYGRNLTVTRTTLETAIDVAESILTNQKDNKQIEIFNSHNGELAARVIVEPTWYLRRAGLPPIENIYIERIAS